jgi:hypothetical protein
MFSSCGVLAFYDMTLPFTLLDYFTQAVKELFSPLMMRIMFSQNQDPCHLYAKKKSQQKLILS